MEITYRSIGVVRSPFREVEGAPIQPPGASGARGTLEVRPGLEEGLKDLEGFSHLILLYHFHRARDCKLVVTPFLDSRPRGVFSTRAPTRPNAIGLSVVRLVEMEGCRIHVENIDILDGTPLLDIKPYVPEFDEQVAVRVGWMEGAGGRVRTQRSDERFR